MIRSVVSGTAVLMEVLNHCVLYTVVDKVNHEEQGLYMEEKKQQKNFRRWLRTTISMMSLVLSFALKSISEQWRCSKQTSCENSNEFFLVTQLHYLST